MNHLPTASIVKTILLVFAGVVAMSLLGICIAIWLVDYAVFTDRILAFLNRQQWKSYFETQVFPAARYQLLRYFLPILLITWSLVLYVFFKHINRYSQNIADFITTTISKISAQFQQFQPIEKKYFIGIILLFALRGVGQIYHYELQYDEAWTYNHFVSKGVLVTAISPNNNHILYTLLACITDYLPIEGKYSLRLPVYLGGIATCFLMYGLLRNFWGWKWALVALAWFAFSPSICFYSMYARGYIFQIFFTILAVWATLKIAKNPPAQQSYYWAIWGIANVLAAYSVPTHIYTWIVLNVFLIIIMFKQKSILKEWFITNIGIAISIVILYFPFLITNGINTLWNAANNDAPSGEALFSYQDKVADWLLVGGGRGTAVYWFQIVILFVLAVFYFVNRKDEFKKQSILLIFLFLALPSFLNLLVGTQPPYRVWCFLAVFIAMAIAVIFNTGVEYLSAGMRKAAYLTPVGLSLFFIVFNIWRTGQHYAIRWSEKIDKDAKEIAQILLDKDIQECYFFSHYDKPLLEYYYLRKSKDLEAVMFDSNSLDYAPFVNSSLYQCVLWDKEDRVPSTDEIDWLRKHYKDTIYENNRVLLIMNYEL